MSTCTDIDCFNSNWNLLFTSVSAFLLSFRQCEICWKYEYGGVRVPIIIVAVVFFRCWTSFLGCRSFCSWLVDLANWSHSPAETSMRRLQRGLSLTRISIVFHFNHKIATVGVHQSACRIPRSLKQSDARRDERDCEGTRNRSRKRRLLTWYYYRCTNLPLSLLITVYLLSLTTIVVVSEILKISFKLKFSCFYSVVMEGWGGRTIAASCRLPFLIMCGVSTKRIQTSLQTGFWTSTVFQLNV